MTSECCGVPACKKQAAIEKWNRDVRKLDEELSDLRRQQGLIYPEGLAEVRAKWSDSKFRKATRKANKLWRSDQYKEEYLAWDKEERISKGTCHCTYPECDWWHNACTCTSSYDPCYDCEKSYGAMRTCWCDPTQKGWWKVCVNRGGASCALAHELVPSTDE
jgi:hypothetical protein